MVPEHSRVSIQTSDRSYPWWSGMHLFKVSCNSESARKSHSEWIRMRLLRYREHCINEASKPFKFIEFIAMVCSLVTASELLVTWIDYTIFQVVFKFLHFSSSFICSVNIEKPIKNSIQPSVNHNKWTLLQQNISVWLILVSKFIYILVQFNITTDVIYNL